MNKINRLICFFIGHVFEEYWTETKHHVYDGRCSRCKCALGRIICNIIPPPPVIDKEHNPMTLRESVNNLSKAVEELKSSIYELLRFDKILSWLSKKIK